MRFFSLRILYYKVDKSVMCILSVMLTRWHVDDRMPVTATLNCSYCLPLCLNYNNVFDRPFFDTDSKDLIKKFIVITFYLIYSCNFFLIITIFLGDRFLIWRVMFRFEWYIVIKFNWIYFSKKVPFYCYFKPFNNFATKLLWIKVLRILRYYLATYLNHLKWRL